jgi:polysaccharide biosynthesis protein PslE
MKNNPPSSREDQGGTLRDLLTVLFKRKAAILTIFLSFVIVVTAVTFLMTPIYEAKSSILVKFGREFVYRPEVGDKAPAVSMSHEEAINSEIDILTSRDIIEWVIKTIRLETLYPELIKNPPGRLKPLEAAVITFQKNFYVEAIKKSSVIKVSFEHSNPKLAAQVVNMAVELFKEKHLQVHSGTESNFLETQLKVYEQDLKESDNKMEKFKQKNRVFALEEQKTLLLRQRMELDTRLKEATNRIDELGKKRASLRTQINRILADKNLYTQTEREKIIVEARSKLLTLQLSEQNLASKYMDDNRTLVNVRKEIQLIKEFLLEEESAIEGKVKTGNVFYQEVEKEALRAETEESALRAKVATLLGQVAQVDRELQALSLQEKDFQDLKRETLTNEKNFRTYVDKREEARISDEMNRQKMANISVIQGAVVPSKPVRPRKALNILLGIILGAVTGLGFGLLSEFTSQGFASPDSAEKRLGLPVLTTIPLKS